MRIQLLFPICFCMMLSTRIQAGVEKISLDHLPETFVATNLFDLGPTKPVPKKGGLMELKWKELRGDWVACRNLAEKLQKTSGDLEPWVLQVRLTCALKAVDGKKEATSLASAFHAVKMSYLREGPWKSKLKDLWATVGFEAAKAETRKNQAENLWQELLDQPDLLEKHQLATILSQLGDLYRARDASQALFYWQKSLELKADAVLSVRIQELQKTMPSIPKPAVADSLPFNWTEPEGAEIITDREISNLLSQNRKPEAARKMVELLNRFPNGRFAKRDRERLPVMLFAAFDRGDETEAQSLRDVMINADPSRLAEWAMQLHRRGDDLGALKMAEKALDSQSGSANAANLLWVVGRSSEFLGENGQAIAAFQKLIQFHSATEEAAEASFRLGLVQLRAGNEATAAKIFERIIAQNKSRYELSARYWRVRALEKTDAAKSALERDEIIRLYPMTYYGLKLRQEKNGNIEFPQSDRSPLESSKGTLWFIGAQKKAWARFKKLSAEGWLLEAQAELVALPSPNEPWALLEWAQVLAKAGQYPTSILVANKAMDGEETLRHPRYFGFTFPRAYSRFIDAEAKKNNLEPVVVRSLVRQESAFGLKAVSSSNAMGLMQLIPPTAREVAQELKIKANIPDDLFRPEINVPMGTYYIAKMMKQFEGTLPFALAAYNAGPTKVGQWVKERPELQALRGKTLTNWKDEIWYDELPWNETSFYVKAILRNILLDQLIDQGRVEAESTKNNAEETPEH